MSALALPLSARFALWFSAWTASRASLDDCRDAIVGDDAAHDVVLTTDDEQQVLPLIVALGMLRRRGAIGAGIALPVPGDPLGLAGPSSFNAEVVEAREGVVLDGAELGLVPQRAGAGVTWTCYPAVSRRQLPDPSEADTTLRRTLLRATDQLADLDVARWRPEAADELIALRSTVDAAGTVFPDTMAPRAVRLAALAVRCRTIVDLALVDEGGSITAAEADARRGALAPLDHAARRGLVAACAFPWDR